MIADELDRALRAAGARVVGPAASVRRARDMLAADAVDLAVLDVNLSGELVFPLADELASRGVPVVFVTGYEARVLPTRFADTPRCEKPVDLDALMALLARRRRDQVKSSKAVLSPKPRPSSPGPIANSPPS